MKHKLTDDPGTQPSGHVLLVFLTESELAQRWRVSVKTLRNARVAGTGCAFFKAKGFVRYAMADVLEFERTHMRSSTSEVIRRGK